MSNMTTLHILTSLGLKREYPQFIFSRGDSDRRYAFQAKVCDSKAAQLG
ncbi:hypothetical protein ALT1545_60007 [Alteromonas macleodii]